MNTCHVPMRFAQLLASLLRFKKKGLLACCSPSLPLSLSLSLSLIASKQGILKEPKPSPRPALPFFFLLLSHETKVCLGCRFFSASAVSSIERKFQLVPQLPLLVVIEAVYVMCCY